MSNIYERYFQIGRESTPGTAAATQIKLAGTSFGIQDETAAPELTASFDGTRWPRKSTKPVRNWTWNYTGAFNTQDAVNLLCLVSNTPSRTPVAGMSGSRYDLVFGTTVETATLEWAAAGEYIRARGCYANELRIEGSADGGDVTISASGPAIGAFRSTVAFTERNASPSQHLQGWDARLYFGDEYTDTIGSSGALPLGEAISYSIVFTNNTTPYYRMGATRERAGVAINRFNIAGSILIELGSMARQMMNNRNGVLETILHFAIGQTVGLGGGSSAPFDGFALALPCVISTYTINETSDRSTVRVDFQMLSPSSSVRPVFNLYTLRNTF